MSKQEEVKKYVADQHAKGFTVNQMVITIGVSKKTVLIALDELKLKPNPVPNKYQKQQAFLGGFIKRAKKVA